MRLIGKKVLIEIVEAAEKNEAGIILPENKRPKNRGKVSIVGPEVTAVSVGNDVQFYMGVGTPIEYEGKKCLFVKEDEIEIVF